MLLRSPDTRFLDWKVKNPAFHLAKLKQCLPWQQFKNTNRLVCSLGSDYGYSDHTTKGHSFSLYPPLKRLMDKLNTELGTNYNSVLLNWYPAGTYCGIGAHKDNEAELVGGSVASVSLGASCIFILQDGYKTFKERIEVTLNDSDVFVMGVDCQKFYYHSIGYTTMESDRISITFRQFKD